MENIRIQAKSLLHDAIAKLDTSVATSAATRIEKRCFQLYGHIPIMYNSKIVLVQDKLDIAILSILQLNPEELINTSSYDIYSNIKEEKSRILSNMDVTQNVSMSIYKCPQCHARNHSIEEIQLRSLDEGATVYATCNICGTRWKP
jgi:DNA-directed RNA polymerase subunit M/transcription elongation factor TFIIS